MCSFCFGFPSSIWNFWNHGGVHPFWQDPHYVASATSVQERLGTDQKRLLDQGRCRSSALFERSRVLPPVQKDLLEITPEFRTVAAQPPSSTQNVAFAQ